MTNQKAKKGRRRGEEAMCLRGSDCLAKSAKRALLIHVCSELVLKKRLLVNAQA